MNQSKEQNNFKVPQDLRKYNTQLKSKKKRAKKGINKKQKGAQ